MPTHWNRNTELVRNTHVKRGAAAEAPPLNAPHISPFLRGAHTQAHIACLSASQSLSNQIHKRTHTCRARTRTL